MSFPGPCVDARQFTPKRLKVLAEELKKRYFLDLKRFLWDQGVQHAEYLPRPLKVYPSRTSPVSHIQPNVELLPFRSQGYLFMEQYPVGQVCSDLCLASFNSKIT